jgi:hypothetical protein
MAALPLSAQFAQLFSQAASAMRRLGALALAVFAGGAAFARWRQRRDEAQKNAA